MTKKSFYENKKTFTIFALHISEEEEYVFIGKTSSPRISAVYSEHICGKRMSTAAYFDKEARPSLYVLETLYITENDAYKHVVAWVRVFVEHKYTCINHDGTLRHAESMLPETIELVRNIERKPLEVILKERYVEHPKDADRIEENSQHSSDCDEIVQINLRLSQSVKQKFDTFRKRTGTNQKEAFLLLLDFADGTNNHTNLNRIIGERDKTIITLKKENEDLKKKLTLEKKTTPDNLLIKQYEFMKFGISTYFDYLHSNSKKGMPLKSLNYKKYMKKNTLGQYEYPEHEGFMALSLEAVLWGNSIHRARFLVGVGENGKHYKLRYYPKKQYIGFDIQDLVEDKYWVGFRMAKDGAMELLAAFPINSIKAIDDLHNSEIKNGFERKPSLDEVIKMAEKRG